MEQCWLVKNGHLHKMMKVVEIKMLEMDVVGLIREMVKNKDI